MKSTLIPVLTGFLATALPVTAQEYLRVTGHEDFDGFGMSLAVLDDLNGDGISEFAVGAYCTDRMGHINGGSVTAFDGATGQIRWMTNGDSEDERLGHCMDRLGDINGDGVCDIVVGAYRDRLGGLKSGSVHVLDGFTGARLYTVVEDEDGAEFGKSIAVISDINGDGHHEWIAGAWLSNNNGTHSGKVSLHSGIDGKKLRTWAGPANSFYGQSVARIGDITGDSKDEFAIGGPRAVNGSKRVGIVAIIDGGNGDRLARLQGTSTSNFGWWIAGPGDLDKDGVPDILIGAPDDDRGEQDAGSITTISGRTQDVIYEVLGTSAREGLGWFVGPAGDVDGDGRPEYLVGSPRHEARGTETGAMRLFRGRDGEPMVSWLGWSEFDKLGAVAMPFSDVNGDGQMDWLIGSPEAGADLAFEPGAASVFLHPELPELRLVELQGGGPAKLRLTGARGGHPIRLYLSFEGMGIDVLRSDLHLDITQALLAADEVAPANGRVSFEGIVPAHLAGAEIWFQAIDWTDEIKSNPVHGIVE